MTTRKLMVKTGPLELWHVFDDEGHLIGTDAIDLTPRSLDATGALATLLAVEGVLAVDDAAAAVGRTAAELTAEAEAWGAAAALADAQAAPRVVDVEVSPGLAADSAQSADGSGAG